MEREKKEKKSKKPPKPVEEDYDRNRKIVEAIAARPENSYCFDCNAHAPRWASINFGVFVCLRCSGFHRNLGVHISKVRSVNLDKWTLEQVMHMDAIGNKRGAEIYEARRPRNFRKPDEYADDRYMDTYIRAKYEHKAFFAKPGDNSDSDTPSGGSPEKRPTRDKDRKSKSKKEKKEKREKKEKKKKASDSEDEAARAKKKSGESSSSDADSEPDERQCRPAPDAGIAADFAAFGVRSPSQGTPSPVQRDDPVANGAPPEVTGRQCRRADEIEDQFMAFAPPKTPTTPAVPDSEVQFKSLQDEVFQLFEKK